MQYPRIPLYLILATALPAWGQQTAQERQLDKVVVTAGAEEEPGISTTLKGNDLLRGRARTSDAASLLYGLPGVSLYGAGGVSSLPAIHGMADDRVRTKVDGMDLIAACPNHMNSPLSYLDPSQIGSIKVYAGITPVSVGGDSIGGTVVVEPPPPTFAARGEGSLVKGEAGAFYRSNGDAQGANLKAVYASESFSIDYAGATAEAENYKVGGNFKTRTDTGRPGRTLPLDEVGSTAYKTRNHALGFALKGDIHLVEAKFGFQDIPYELYPNQRMDMLDNRQHRFNLRYVGRFGWGTLEAAAYRETVKHFMNFGADKQFLYGTAPGMPMNTDSRHVGVSLKASIELAEGDLLLVGAEARRFQLDDWWPPSGTGSMAPGNFLNVNDSRRDRTALFGERETRLSPQWLTLFGVRYERLTTDAGDVYSYFTNNVFPTTAVGDMGNQNRDAFAFNAADHKKTDNNWDLTALARYTPNATQDVEFGFARKVRSPNLYERYTWSTWSMAAVMNNFVGDGNGYVGNLDLKPEKAHTVSATFDWHTADRGWEFKVTPYYTRVADYVDAVQWNGTTNLPATTRAVRQFSVLKFVNQSARVVGLDLSGRMPLASTGWGDWGLKGLLSYTNGKNRDTGDDLYNMMPLNAKLTLTQKLGGWDNAVELAGVKSKDKLSDVRNEIGTPGYGLVNLRASYAWKLARLDFGIENLFDKLYVLPLGGAYVGQGTTMSLNPASGNMPWGIPVPGPGRSLYAGLNFKF